jgi:hypothetical protein
MIVLTTSANAQIFNVIPRDYSLSDFTMTIRDDSTNVTVTYQITGAAVDGNYVTFENIFSPILVEITFMTSLYLMVLMFFLRIESFVPIRPLIRLMVIITT